MNLLGVSPASPISEALITTRMDSSRLAADMGIDSAVIARENEHHGSIGSGLGGESFGSRGGGDVSPTRGTAVDHVADVDHIRAALARPLVTLQEPVAISSTEIRITWKVNSLIISSTQTDIHIKNRYYN